MPAALEVVHVELPGQLGHSGLGGQLTDLGLQLSGATRVVVLRISGAAESPAATTGAAGEVAPERWLDWTHRPDLIALAVVSGNLGAAASEAALACDLRLVEAGSSLWPALPTGSGVSSTLVASLGFGRALHALLTRSALGAAELDRAGLATLVPSGGLTAAIDELVATLLTMPRLQVTETKALLLSALRQDVTGQRSAERAARDRSAADAAGRPAG